MGNHSRATQRHHVPLIALVVMAPLALLTVVGLIWLWPTEQAYGGQGGDFTELTGRVTAVHQQECPDQDVEEMAGCDTATVELEDGRVLEDVEMSGGAGQPDYSVGDDVVVLGSQLPEGWSYAVVDHHGPPGCGCSASSSPWLSSPSDGGAG